MLSLLNYREILNWMSHGIIFFSVLGIITMEAIELAKLQDSDAKKYEELLRSAFEQVLDELGITFDKIRGIRKMNVFF